MNGWLYALLCLTLPAAWGILMFGVFEVLQRRRQRQDVRKGAPPIDYTI